METRRRAAAANPPEPDLAAIVANLQRQLREQQQETDRLREQLAPVYQSEARLYDGNGSREKV